MAATRRLPTADSQYDDVVDMRRVFLLVFWQFVLLAGGRLFADIVTLKDGRQISGLVESGNIQELHIKVGDQSQTVDIHEVQAIQFGVSLPPPPPPKAAHLAPEPAPAGAAPTLKAGAPPRADPKSPTFAPGGTITLCIDAEIADDPIVLDAAEVAPADANAFLPVAEIKSAGLAGCGKVDGGVESRAGSQATRTLTGQGPKNAQQTPSTNSKRGCQ
jgi:hypothetical protein